MCWKDTGRRSAVEVLRIQLDDSQAAMPLDLLAARFEAEIRDAKERVSQ